ncbi:MAG: asparaginase [Glaciimonas sp.]|nr:asparaginase [Glaciimonas sp.]
MVLRTLRVIATGGTFDKHYDEIAGELVFAASHLPQVIARTRINSAIELEELPLLDSLDMQDIDRRRVLASCANAEEEAIVIIHGTDTMQETAAVLGAGNLAKAIVVTGAMIPYEITNSDALFNFGFACGVVQYLPHGVYVAMNGKIFSWDKVQKNCSVGVFEASD